jgi:DNA replication protein DnaC
MDNGYEERGIREKGSCEECGGVLHEFFVKEPFLLKAFRRDGPFWMESGCMECLDRKEKEERRIQKTRLRQERIDGLLKNSMLSERYLDKGFDNYEVETEPQRVAFEICKRFAEDFEHSCKSGMWMFLHGRCGTGKGHLSAAIIHEVVRQGYSAHFTKMQRLLLSIKETFSRDSQVRTSELIDRLINVDLLVIDEVGVQYDTDFEWLTIYEILDSRYERMKPLILISNEPWKRIEELLGVKIIDRFYEGESLILPFQWNSYRRR